MPTINKFFLVKLVLILLGGCGAIAGLHTIQASRIPDALKRQADHAVDNGKTDMAIHYLRQYLEFKPTDTDALERLATLMKERSNRDPSDQLLLYDKILRSDPNRHAIRRDALIACLRIGRYTDAEMHAGLLLKEFPDDAELWQRQAAAQGALQKVPDARKSYETAIKTDPRDPTAYQRYAQYLWRELKSPPEAKSIIDQLVVALPHDAEAYLTRARFEQQDGSAAKVIPDLQKALELDPENANALLMLAEQYQKQRKLVEARDCLVDAMRFYPQDERTVRSLAWLDLNMGNIGSAVAVLEEGMNRVKNSFELLVPLADLLVQLGETDRSEAIVKKLEGQTTAQAKLQVKYLKARLAMRANSWGTAVELLTSLRTDAVNLPGLENQTHLLLAVCYQRRGETTQEQDTLKLLLNKDPNHLAARIGLAQSYLTVGRTGDAITEYQHAVRSNFAGASTHATLLRLKARELKLANGQPQEWQQLDRVTAEIGKLYGPASSEPIQLRAEVAQARGEYRQAAAILQAEAKRRPGDIGLWVALADAVAQVAGVSAALGILDEAQAAAGDGPDVRLARADLYARDPAHLRPIEPLATQIDSWPDADQTRLLYGLVEIYDRLGDEAKVVQTYKKIAARRPLDLGVWEILGERATLFGDAQTATHARNAATKIDPTGKTNSLFVAWSTISTKSLDSARASIAALTNHFGGNPDHADVCVTLGKLNVLIGDNVVAGKMFERAVRLEPSRFPPIQAYLAHLGNIGADDAIAAVLARLAADPRWAQDPFRRAIRGAMKQTPPDVAKKLLTPAWQYLEREPDGLGWLGESYLALGFRAEASECFEKATMRPTTTADDWLRLALRCAESGSPERAIGVLQTAKEKLPAPLYYTTLASFAESNAAPKTWQPSVANPTDKRQLTQSQLALKLSRFQRAEAIELLDQFLKGTPPATDTVWAKRNLAMLLAVRGGMDDRKRAMDLLVNSDEANGDTADEKRSTAAVLTALSRYLDGTDRKLVLERATKALQALVAETRTPLDAYLLAQVYRSAGNRKASTEVLNNLLTADPKNLEFHIMALEELSEMGQLAAAEPFAQRLLGLYPADFRAISAVARFECLANRPDRAFVVAESYIRTADASAGDLPAKSARVAELLDELARMPTVRRTEAGHKMIKSAVERFESLIATRPEAVVAAAGLLGFDDRHADGFALIEKQSKTLPSRTKAAAGLSVLRTTGASDQQFTLVRQWLDVAKRDEPDSLPLQLNEGEFFAMRMDYANAERAYEAVLAKDPRNVVALNNLAWILAPRPQSSVKALALVDRAVAEIGFTGEVLDTRARIRIAAKQFELAEKDLVDALSQEKTPLRLFHMALAKQGQTPSNPNEATKAFRSAKERGLDAKAVHPADLPQYRVFEADVPPKRDANEHRGEGRLLQ